MKVYASRQDDWEDLWSFLRVKAIAFLRESIAQAKQQNNTYSNYVRPSCQALQTLLIQIFLWEENVQAAWEESLQGHCSNAVQLQLAEQRGKSHPKEAIQIYQAHIEFTLNLKNNQAYQRAIEFLLKIKALMAKLGQQQKFKTYLKSLRITHKAKRNFIKLLESTKGLY